MIDPADISILDIPARPRVQVYVKEGGVMLESDEDSILIDISDVEAVAEALQKGFHEWNRVVAEEMAKQ